MRSSLSQRVAFIFLAVTLGALAAAVWIAWQYQLNLPTTVVALLPGVGTSYFTWQQFGADRGRPPAPRRGR